MKKKIAVTTIVGLLLQALASIAFALMGKVVAMFKGTQIAGPRLILDNLTKFLEAFFQKMDIMSIVILSVAGVILLLVIIQLIMWIRKKHGAGFWITFAGLLFAFLTFAFLTLTLVPGQSVANGNALYTSTFGSNTYTAEGARFGAYLLFVRAIQAKQWIGLLYWIAPILWIIGFILSLVGLICEMKLLAGLPKPVKAKQSDDEVVVIHDEDLESEESRAAAEDALAAGGYPERHAQTQVPAGPAVQGPFLIQYINTYAPADGGKKNTVPVEEIQGNMNGQKPLSADDIRKIIQEELGEKKEQPVIVNVPAAPKEEAPKGVTPDDVRKILSEELGRYLAAEKEPEEEAEIFVEEEPTPALTKEEIREIVASELAKNKPEPEKKEEPVDVRAVIRDELEAHRRELEEEAARKAAKAEEEKARQEELEQARAEAAEQARKEMQEEAERKAAEEEAARKAEEEEAARKAAEEEKAPAVTAEDIRAIVAEELAKAEPEQKEEEPEQDLREVIREVLREELKDLAPKEEPAPAPEPAPTPVVNIIVKKAEAEPEPVKEEAPAPVVVASEPAPAEPDPAQKIIRIPFPERMAAADDDLKQNYNELKSEILSYGDVKSRISNTGDTFRAHTVTFVKITIAGKGLKLYFALDPKDYANSTLPVQDASAKAIYRDIPLVFKVKSELSLRRAKQLIADVMEKNGYEQGKIEKHDWAEELKNVKPIASKDDEDDDE